MEWDEYGNVDDCTHLGKLRRLRSRVGVPTIASGFTQHAERFAGLRFVDFGFFHSAEADLNSFVPLLFLSHYLRNRKRPRGDDGRSGNDAFVVEDLGHPSFGAEHVLHSQVSGSRFQVSVKNSNARNGGLYSSTIGPYADVACPP